MKSKDEEKRYCQIHRRENYDEGYNNFNIV